MTILALDCSSAVRGAAVLREGELLCEMRLEQPARSFSAVALAQKALAKAGLQPRDIALIALGLGPGSYTGVRSSIAFAQGWQLALNTQIQGINSFEAIARTALERGLRGRIRVMADAQRNELYYGAFEITDSGARAIEPLRIAPFSEATAGSGPIVGPGISRLLLGSEDIYPHAAQIGRLALGHPNPQPAETLEPIYLRETSFVKAPPPKWL